MVMVGNILFLRRTLQLGESYIPVLVAFSNWKKIQGVETVKVLEQFFGRF